MTDTPLPELTDEHTITYDGAPRDIVMKFALLRELTRAFPGPNDPQMVFQDPELFEAALAILLIPRTDTGKVPPENEEWSLDDHDFKPDEAIGLVKWAMEHVVRFFLSKITTMTTLGEQSIPQIEALLSSLPGLKALASKKASAGPMASNTPSSDASTGE